MPPGRWQRDVKLMGEDGHPLRWINENGQVGTVSHGLALNQKRTSWAAASFAIWTLGDRKPTQEGIRIQTNSRFRNFALVSL